jgi:Predicted signal transduction protein with a C-terminal ATPase domain
LIVAVKNSFFMDIIKNIDMGTGSSVFIINSDRQVVTSSNTEIKIGVEYEDSSILEKIHVNEGTDNHSFPIHINSSNYLASFFKIKNTDWYLVSAVPYSYLNSETYKIGYYIVFICIICLVFSVLFSFIFSQSISIPLSRLLEAIDRTKKGDFSQNITDTNMDEIAEVTRNFNNMVNEINLLLNSVKKEEKQKRIAELKALQAQINPHFIYNTLNTIRWLADAQKASNISSLVSSFIELLHVSMGNGNDLITLREEVEYLQSYINVQKYRYFDEFDVTFNIQEEIMECRILKFILQPLVENSIIHGLEPMKGHGEIVVKAYREQDDIKIFVTDNGVGIQEEQIKEINSNNHNTSSRRFSSIGIRNVDERLKLNFGEQYGIHITSIPNMFTTIELTIPCQMGQV